MAKDETNWGGKDLQNDLGTKRFKDAAIHRTKRLRNLEIYRRTAGRKDCGTQRSTGRPMDETIQGMLGFV